MDFLDIEVNEKMFYRILIISIIVIIFYLSLSMASILFFKSYKLGPNTTVSNEDINTHIDVLEVSHKKIEIAGWAYKEEEPIEVVDSSYVIRNQETGKMYLMKTKMEENINLKGTDMEMAGIHAQCLLIGIPKGKYDIYVLLKDKDKETLANTLISVDI